MKKLIFSAISRKMISTENLSYTRAEVHGKPDTEVANCSDAKQICLFVICGRPPQAASQGDFSEEAHQLKTDSASAKRPNGKGDVQCVVLVFFLATFDRSKGVPQGARQSALSPQGSTYVYILHISDLWLQKLTRNDGRGC